MKTACKAVVLALVVLAGGLFFAAGCSTPAPAGSSEVVPDRDIVSDVQDRLRSDPVTSRCTFSITSDRGVVTVGGFMPNELTKSRAMSIVRGAPGVKTVVDDTRH